MRLFFIGLCFFVALLLDLMAGNLKVVMPFVPLMTIFVTLLHGGMFAILPTFLCGVILDFTLGRPFFLSTILLLVFLIVVSEYNPRFALPGKTASFACGFVTGLIWHWGLISLLWVSGEGTSRTLVKLGEFLPYLQTAIIGGIAGFGIYGIMRTRIFQQRSRNQIPATPG